MFPRAYKCLQRAKTAREFRLHNLGHSFRETLNKSHARIASSDLGDLKPQNSST
jgi:hypothetical protein